MNNSPLEFLAEKYGNVVKYDREGNVAGIFVRFNKMKSCDLVAGLPDHIHPAFIINGEIQDSILLGKYKAGQNGEKDAKLVSMPNIAPCTSVNMDDGLEKMRKAGPGITGMTVADYGFIKLLAQKEGWEPEGNTDFGHSLSVAIAWMIGVNAKIGDERGYDGYIYECMIAHTTTAELKPDIAPNYWKRGKCIGGIPENNPLLKDGAHQTGYNTLNGSGPINWYLGNKTESMADLIGSCTERQHGYRVYDCELQIIEDNNAADPNADLSASSAAWKAILPNKSDDGYTLVAPGTPGTLHWNWKNNQIMLDTQCDVIESGKYRGTNFKDLTANTDRLPYVPYIAKELGLFPTGPEDQTKGQTLFFLGHGERISERGGNYACGQPGLGYVDSRSERMDQGVGSCGRPRAIR